MNKKVNIETYQIRVNRLNSEFIPYSKYIKKNYPKLNRIVPKYSILYKVNYRPELANNEYQHETLDNIKINFDDYNKSNIKTIEREIYETYQNIDDNNKYKNYCIDKPLRNVHTVHRLKNNDTFSPHSNINKIDLEIKENKIVYGKIELPRKKLNRDNYNKNNNSQSYSNYSNKIKDNKQITENNDMKSRKTFNTSKYNKYRKNLSKGMVEFFNKANNTEASETSFESLSNKGYKIKKIILYSGKNNKYLGEKTNNNKNDIEKNENKKDSATLKMEIYRIKLFHEFFKHFQKFYKNFIKNHFNYFLDKIKSLKENQKSNVINETLDYGHKSKNISLLTNEKSTKKSLIDILISSNKKDYFKINNENKKYNLKFKNIFNTINEKNINNKNNYKNLSITLSKKKYKKKILLKDNNLNNLSLSIQRKKKGIESPCFSFMNKIIINKDMSLGKESINENDLFRDSKKLNKKYEQIQRRRKNIFDKDIGILNNQSIDFNNNDISNEFNVIRKYIQEVKKENENSNNNRNTVGYGKNKKIKKLIKINNKEKHKDKNNKGIENEEIKDKILNIDDNNKKFKIMKVNVDKNLVGNDGSAKKVFKYYKENKKSILHSQNKNNNSFQGNKNDVYFIKKPNKENKIFSIVIKNIETRDKLIHIHINYYFFKWKKNHTKLRYNFLKKSKSFSINIINKNALKAKLSSIKEEDISIQNSKILEDSDNAKYNDKKRVFFLIKNIYKIYKMHIFNKIKNFYLICDKNSITKEDIDENNIKISNIKEKNEKINKNNIKSNNMKIYNKKRGFRLNKIEGEIKSNYENFDKKIKKFRNYLINYFLSIKNCNYKIHNVNIIESNLFN